ncbi:hypothetical protein A1O7_05569 [Cladophialophora yegresii CBS 114405]|uniref:Uncharacterized protein n=1 Tax=Cladophialophora yegresii CBS 114405 TaxID=1182544 RepID=W9VZK3_9EURO|nr:uncharacterized protein A1O7_05569 [Cladophialophora yegresii CBS 114405]EXJ58145.1 hypothetical protein A1O7_05569 [Cladophialophora yegresii CBS 114405]
MWESEESSMRPWRFNRLWATRYCDYKPITSTSASNQETKESPNEQNPESDFKTIYNDFESFRAAVDRAIARDPYGTLFGRRLQSPPSSNNSSWTSFSWFTDPKEIKTDTDVSSQQSKPAETTDTSTEKPVAATSTTFAQQTPKETTMIYSEEAYEYDPITMRKVPTKKHMLEDELNMQPASPEPGKRSPSPKPKTQSSAPEPAKDPAASEAKSWSSPPEPTKQSSESQLKQPFLRSMFFQEHGVEIPVKTFSSHKVYGYGNSDTKATETLTEIESNRTRRGFDNSRKHQLRDLMKRAKGNTIDTTALFTESGSRSEPEPVAGPFTDGARASKKPRESPEPDDTLPLFSGTTYEARAIRQARANPSDWLAKEGFRQPANETVSSESTGETAVDSPFKESNPRLETALDRAQPCAAQAVEKSARLQTSLDRQVSAARRQSPSTEKSTEKGTDVDRAAAIPETGGPRQIKASNFESESDARQTKAADKTDFVHATPKTQVSATKLTKTINNVLDHIREHPDGIVAKTMKSMTNLNENYKKYIRSDAVKGLTEKLIFRDESLSKTPSIYNRPAKSLDVKPFTPSHDALETDREQQERTASLRTATEKAKDDADVQNAQISRLATEIKAVYESEYGTIDPNHRQSAPDPAMDASEVVGAPSDPVSSQVDGSKAHPLSTASLKPGIVTNPVIDAHITKFEPKLAELVDDAKQIRAQLREISTQAQELGKTVPSTTAEANEPTNEVKPPPSKLSEVIQATKEVRRVLHETKNAIRSIETRRPDIAWKTPQLSGSDFGKKRIDVKAQKAGELDSSEAPVEKDTEVVPGVHSPSQNPEENDQKVVPEPVHTPSGSPTWNDEQIPPIESLRDVQFDSPYLVLSYNSSTGKVNCSTLDQPAAETSKSSNMVQILGRLENAPEFLKHFQAMQGAGYSLYDGTENTLVFRKEQPEQATASAAPKTIADMQQVAEQATPSLTTEIPPNQPLHTAATVLDEIPSDLDPSPGPAAPTAPVSRPLKGKPRVRRQEKVFSGTIRPIAASDEKANTSQADKDTVQAPKESLWRRLARGVKRTMLTVAALGVGAYTIGFVAEGLGAHSQQQKGVENTETPGPRKRIVMTGQRPGIFSTESSR